MLQDEIEINGRIRLAHAGRPGIEEDEIGLLRLSHPDDEIDGAAASSSTTLHLPHNPTVGGMLKVPLQEMLEYTDTDGDVIRFQKRWDGSLVKSVNAVEKRVVTELIFNERTGVVLDQQHQGGSPVDLKVLHLLRALASDCKVPHNLPQPVIVNKPTTGVVCTYKFAKAPAAVGAVPTVIAGRVREAVAILAVDIPGIAWQEQRDGHLVIQAIAGDGCWSHVGRVPPHLGGNRINLDPLWSTDRSGPPIGTILHEFLHMLGMKHEHQRDDRHGHAEVDPEEEKKNPINLAISADIHPFPYDSASIMHYPSGIGLLPGPKAWAKFGQRKCLSQQDKLFLNMLYPPVAGKNGYAPKRGRTGLWYCGRKVMANNNFPFGCMACDGVCGPSNGPNCPSCVMFGVGEGNDYPLRRMNTDGNMCMQGETGLFYCEKRYTDQSSRVVEATVVKHDGVCGPGNGPNCPACRKLLV